jgi:RimJ/RimL family protein N-acetyltransferase
MWNLSPRTICGRKVQLEPLSENLYGELCDCLLNEPDGWFSRMFGFNKPESVSVMIKSWSEANQARRALSFVTRDLVTSKVAGLSHFMRIDERNRQLEIGGTQVGKLFRRSHVNTETKLLMLSEAFEVLGAIRVYFKVDSENEVSKRSTLRIGAKFEGSLRNDCILPDGSRRDYHIYSILDSEWPDIKAHLYKLS